MKRNVIPKIISSVSISVILFVSIFPSGVIAQENDVPPPTNLEETPTAATVIESTENTSNELYELPAVLPEATVVEVIEVAETDHSADITTKEVEAALDAIPAIMETTDVETTDAIEATITEEAIAASVEEFASQVEGETVKEDSVAIGSTSENIIIDIPKNPEESVTLETKEGPSIEITLPYASTASEATVIADDTVAYSADNGAANAVQVQESGVQMLTVIDNANAPTEYPYSITLPEGGHIELTEDGGALIVDLEGNVIATIEKPWAKDANNTALETWFTTDGTNLTQHIVHNVAGVMYPVTADPWLFMKLISYVEWSGATLRVYPTMYSRVAAPLQARKAAWKEVKRLAPEVNNRSMKNQFFCHWDIVPVRKFKSSWNLDTWRPDVGYWETVRAKCNP